MSGSQEDKEITEPESTKSLDPEVRLKSTRNIVFFSFLFLLSLLKSLSFLQQPVIPEPSTAPEKSNEGEEPKSGSPEGKGMEESEKNDTPLVHSEPSSNQAQPPNKPSEQLANQTPLGEGTRPCV